MPKSKSKSRTPPKSKPAKPRAPHAVAKPALQYIPWHTIPLEDLNPLLQRQFVVGQEIMLARVLLKKGCIVPEHSHHNEQLTYVLEGALKFWIDGKEIVVNAGETLCIPSRICRTGPKRSKTRLTSTYSTPPRADWINKTDQYLRGKKVIRRHGLFLHFRAGCVAKSASQFPFPLHRLRQCDRRRELRISAAPIAEICSKLPIRAGPKMCRRRVSEIDLASAQAFPSPRSTSAASGAFANCSERQNREQAVITLREGNTPLYELPHCARITGVPRLFAQASRLESRPARSKIRA
jgi:hypothetical protein